MGAKESSIASRLSGTAVPCPGGSIGCGMGAPASACASLTPAGVSVAAERPKGEIGSARPAMTAAETAAMRHSLCPILFLRILFADAEIGPQFRDNKAATLPSPSCATRTCLQFTWI
jgi:hypothetical protein